MCLPHDLRVGERWSLRGELEKQYCVLVKIVGYGWSLDMCNLGQST